MYMYTSSHSICCLRGVSTVIHYAVREACPQSFIMLLEGRVGSVRGVIHYAVWGACYRGACLQGCVCSYSVSTVMLLATGLKAAVF